MSGLITAPLGFIVGSKIDKLNVHLHGRLVPGIYLMGTVLLWIVASIS